MDNPFHWIIDYFAAEPVRVSAVLRLPLIALIAVLVWIWEVEHWLAGRQRDPDHRDVAARAGYRAVVNPRAMTSR